MTENNPATVGESNRRLPQLSLDPFATINPSIGHSLHKGTLSEVFLINDRVARKKCRPSIYPKDPNITIRHEIHAYERIGPHPRIARWIPNEDGDCEDHLDLEYYRNGNVVDYIIRNKENIIPSHLLIRWGHQIIEAMIVIHEKDVIHSDLNLRQILLDDNLNALLSDFNASSCLGQPALGWEMPTHFLPRDLWAPNNVRSDLFALGSTLFEVTCGQTPYQEFYPPPPGDQILDAAVAYYDGADEADRHIWFLYSQGIFPDVSGLFCGRTILKCWETKFRSAEEVLQSFEDDVRSLHEPPRIPSPIVLDDEF